MKLQDLIESLDLRVLAGSTDKAITEITDDSRTASPGCLFIARGGTQKDGRDFVNDALAKGATAILTDIKVANDGPADSPITWLHTPQIDNALVAVIAEKFFGNPSRKLKLVGITGTNGKTTTVFLVQHLLRRAGVKTGIIGTVIIDDGHTKRESNLTTPGAIEISRILSQMVKNHCVAAVMETSSHALHQGRVIALDFDVAAFTNLTGDHLDYHKTMDQYAAAKAILFEHLRPDAVAIVNAEDAYASRMLKDCKARTVNCRIVDKPALPAKLGDERKQEITAQILQLGAGYSRVQLQGAWTAGGPLQVDLPLVGRHNVMNALQAIACAQALAPMGNGALKDALLSCPAPPGRLEPVTMPAASAISSQEKSTLPTVLVDYAHTHDALENVLTALRPLTKGKLITVFGCGGDRDRTKRPKMAAVATAKSDRIIITSDNPRTENPQAIIEEILTGITQKDMARVTVEPDRARAIAQTIANAGPSDVILLAGKGHENYQIIGTTKRHFDDREQATTALLARLGKSKADAAVNV